MFKKLTRVPQKVAMVEEAREHILEFIEEHDLTKLIDVFNDSLIVHETIAYVMVEIHIGSLVRRLSSLVRLADIEIKLGLFSKKVYWINYHGSRITLNAKYITSTAVTIEIIVVAVLDMLGYVSPDRNEPNHTLYLPYKLGGYISESFKIQ